MKVHELFIVVIPGGIISPQHMNSFEINVGNSPEMDGTYFIIPKLENLAFDKNYLEQETSDGSYVYFSLDGGENIGFTTTEDIDFATLPAFISPSLSKLSVSQTKIDVIETNQISKQTLIILVVLLMIFVGSILYFVLHQWYERRYEDFLFKNRNDLYNLISYIHKMKKQGIDDKKVSAGLKKAGWSSEQITYLMRKYYGKRTGMFGLPIGKLFGFGKPELQQGNMQQSGFSSRKI